MSNVTVIPAQPGFFVVYSQDDDLFLGDQVIAWGITAELEQGYGLHSVVYPIITDGDPGDNYVGFVNPDGRVTISHGGMYDSLEEAQKDRAKDYKADRL